MFEQFGVDEPAGSFVKWAVDGDDITLRTERSVTYWETKSELYLRDQVLK